MTDDTYLDESDIVAMDTDGIGRTETGGISSLSARRIRPVFTDEVVNMQGFSDEEAQRRRMAIEHIRDKQRENAAYTGLMAVPSIAKGTLINAAGGLEQTGLVAAELTAKGVYNVTKGAQDLAFGAGEAALGTKFYRQERTMWQDPWFRAADSARQMKQAAKKRLDDWNATHGEEHPFAKAIESIAPSAMASVGVALATGGASAAVQFSAQGALVGGAAMSEGYDSYIQELEKGRDPTQSRVYGGLKGLVAGGAEKLGLSITTKMASVSARFALAGFVAEASEGAIEWAGDLAIDTGFGVKSLKKADGTVDWNSVQTELVDGITQTVVGGLVGGATGYGMYHITRKKVTTSIDKIMQTLPEKTQQAILDHNGVKNVAGLADRMIMQVQDSVHKNITRETPEAELPDMASLTASQAAFQDEPIVDQSVLQRVEPTSEEAYGQYQDELARDGARESSFQRYQQELDQVGNLVANGNLPLNTQAARALKIIARVPKTDDTKLSELLERAAKEAPGYAPLIEAIVGQKKTGFTLGADPTRLTNIANVIQQTVGAASNERAAKRSAEYQRIQDLRAVVRGHINTALTARGVEGRTQWESVRRWIQTTGSSFKTMMPLLDIVTPPSVREELNIDNAQRLKEHLEVKYLDKAVGIAQRFFAGVKNWDDFTVKVTDPQTREVLLTYTPKSNVSVPDAAGKWHTFEVNHDVTRVVSVAQALTLAQKIINPDRTVNKAAYANAQARCGLSEGQIYDLIGVTPDGKLVDEATRQKEQAISGVRVGLTQNEIDYALALRDEISPEIYDLVSPVYAHINDRELGKVENYVQEQVDASAYDYLQSQAQDRFPGVALQLDKLSVVGPINHAEVADGSEYITLSDVLFDNGTGSSDLNNKQLLARTYHGMPMQLLNADLAVQSTIHSMAHYVAMADINRNLQALFSDGGYEIQGMDGQPARQHSLISPEVSSHRQLQNAMNHFLNVLQYNSLVVPKQVDSTMRLNPALTIIATAQVANPVTALAQLQSSVMVLFGKTRDPVAFMQSAADTIKTMVEIASGQDVSNPLHKEYRRMAFSRSREQGKITAELARLKEASDSLQANLAGEAKLNAKTLGQLTYLLRKMDGFSTLWSFDALYKSGMADGRTAEEAALDAITYINATHQSGDLTQVAPIAGAQGVPGRVATLFLQAQIQMANACQMQFNAVMMNPPGSKEGREALVSLIGLLLFAGYVSPWMDAASKNLGLVSPNPLDDERIKPTRFLTAFGIQGQVMKFGADLAMANMIAAHKDEDFNTINFMQSQMRTAQTFPGQVGTRVVNAATAMGDLIKNFDDFRSGYIGGDKFYSDLFRDTALIMQAGPLLPAAAASTAGVSQGVFNALQVGAFAPWISSGLQTSSEIMRPETDGFQTRFKRIALAIFGTSAYSIDKAEKIDKGE